MENISFKLLNHNDVDNNEDYEQSLIEASSTESVSSNKASFLSDITYSDSDGDSGTKFVVFCVPPNCCVEINTVLTQYLMKVDRISGEKGDMFSRHSNFQPLHRSLLLDWMMEICDFFRTSRDTYYSAIDYVDRYLSVSRDVMRDQLQLIGLTSLYLASKWEEVNSIHLGDLICIVDDLFTDEQVISTERQILQALDYKTSLWTLNKWLTTLLHLAQCSVSLDDYVLLNDLLDLVMLDAHSLRFSHSILASACIYVVTSVRVTFPKDSPYQLFEMCQCVVWIQKYWKVLSERPFPKERIEHLSPQQSQCAIVKYSTRQFYGNILELYVNVNEIDLIPSLRYQIIC